MRIAFIGMSGSGKSHWSKKLAAAGYRRECCDERIADRLSDLLVDAEGRRCTLGEWMGLPGHALYTERERQYLECEKTVLGELLDALEAPGAADENTVIDTTGSVIHTGEDLLKRLSGLATVVYLVSPPEIRPAMQQAYVQNPRPILWRGMYRPRAGESREAAVSRCYAALFAHRDAIYRRWADIFVDYEFHGDESVSAADMIRFIETRMISTKQREPTCSGG
jgi:shikimate kinase